MVAVISPAAVLSCLSCGAALELDQPRPEWPELMLGVCTGDRCRTIWTMQDHAPDGAPPDWRIGGRYTAQPLWVA